MNELQQVVTDRIPYESPLPLSQEQEAYKSIARLQDTIDQQATYIEQLHKDARIRQELHDSELAKMRLYYANKEEQASLRDEKRQQYRANHVEALRAIARELSVVIHDVRTI